MTKALQYHQTPPEKPSTEKPNQRSWIRVVIVFIMITLHNFYELIFTHKLFFHTLFRPSISNAKPPIKLNIGYWNKIQFKIILLIRYISKDQFWGQLWLKQVHSRIIRNLEQQDIDSSILKMPIPTVKAEEISAEDFWDTYVRTNTPVVIKGGAVDTTAYHNWTIDMFRERCGDLEVRLINQSKNEHEDSMFRFEMGTIKQVIDSRGTENKLYIVVCANIFNAYQELIDELGCLKFQDYVGGNSTFFAGAQLFLGVHPSSGSHYHCERGNNLFFEIHGKKQWTLVHPDYLWLMYPMLEEYFISCGSFIKNDYSQTYLDEYAPLHKYCPRYEAILEPGDILFNPSWVWHKIENLDEETIGVGTRWPDFNFKQKRSNLFFDLMQLISPTMWKINFGVLVDKDPNGLGDTLLDSVANVFKEDDELVMLGREKQMRAREFHRWSQEEQF